MVKNPPADAGDIGSTSGLGRSPGEGNDNPLQCFCLGHPMDRGGLQFMGWQRIINNLVTKQHPYHL